MTSTSLVARQGSMVVRPAVRVELSERLYQGVFGAGLATVTGLAVFSALIALLQPVDDVLRSSAATVAALAFTGLLYRARHGLYWQMRRRPSLVLAVAAPLAACAVAAGPHNEQMFYVVAGTISVVGVVAPLSLTAAASAIGASGIAAPYLIAGGGPYGIVGAALVLPILFWLVAARLAEFLLVEDLDPVLVPGPATSSDVVDAPTSPGPAEPPPPPSQRSGARLPMPPLRRDVRLTPRQTQVLLLVCEGLRHAEIAECLGITTKRVRDLLRDARERTNAATTAQLVGWHFQTLGREPEEPDRQAAAA